MNKRINNDNLYWETEGVASENRLSSEFTHLFTSLGKNQIIRICGKSPVPTSEGNMSNSVRSSGYIDRHIGNPDVFMVCFQKQHIIYLIQSVMLKVEFSYMNLLDVMRMSWRKW